MRISGVYLLVGRHADIGRRFGFDGNHRLPSGLWGELRDSIYRRYGGPDKVSTGWVSNTLFEPSTGNAILQNMVHLEEQINLYLLSTLEEVRLEEGQWRARINTPDGSLELHASLFVDATELGDWAAKFEVPYRLGMDSREETGEIFAPERANDIIQDLTYVLTLKDYGTQADQTIAPPPDTTRNCSGAAAVPPIRIPNHTSIASKCWITANYLGTST